MKKKTTSIATALLIAACAAGCGVDDGAPTGVFRGKLEGNYAIATSELAGGDMFTVIRDARGNEVQSFSYSANEGLWSWWYNGSIVTLPHRPMSGDEVNAFFDHVWKRPAISDGDIGKKSLPMLRSGGCSGCCCPSMYATLNRTRDGHYSCGTICG